MVGDRPWAPKRGESPNGEPGSRLTKGVGEVICLAPSMHERPERDVYVASVWHIHATLLKSHVLGNRAQ